jgi:hypothetical protein
VLTTLLLLAVVVALLKTAEVAALADTEPELL